MPPALSLMSMFGDVNLHVGRLLTIKKILENYPGLIYCVKTDPVINQSEAGTGGPDAGKYDESSRGSSILLKAFKSDLGKLSFYFIRCF